MRTPDGIVAMLLRSPPAVGIGVDDIVAPALSRPAAAALVALLAE
jgi:hypothetical protein